jgi:hypothetical protein
LKLHGKEWRKVQQHVFSRSSTQARSHAQKFFVKIDKKGISLEQFLETLNLEILRSKMLTDELADEDAIDELLLPSEPVKPKKKKGNIMNMALPYAGETKDTVLSPRGHSFDNDLIFATPKLCKAQSELHGKRVKQIPFTPQPKRLQPLDEIEPLTLNQTFNSNSGNSNTYNINLHGCTVFLNQPDKQSVWDIDIKSSKPESFFGISEPQVGFGSTLPNIFEPEKKLPQWPGQWPGQ